MRRADPPQALLLTCVLSHVTILPSLALFWRRRWPYEFFFGLVGLICSFLYHMCQALKIKFFLTEGQWHVLDNIFVIINITNLFVYMSVFTSGRKELTLKVVGAFGALIAQLRAPWDLWYTIVPIVAYALIPIVWVGFMGRGGRRCVGGAPVGTVRLVDESCVAPSPQAAAAASRGERGEAVAVADRTSSVYVLPSPAHPLPPRCDRESSSQRFLLSPCTALGSVYNYKALAMGVGTSLCAVPFFVLGLDDANDPYRMFHGLWHIFVGGASYYLWQTVRCPVATNLQCALFVDDYAATFAVLHRAREMRELLAPRLAASTLPPQMQRRMVGTVSAAGNSSTTAFAVVGGDEQHQNSLPPPPHTPTTAELMARSNGPNAPSSAVSQRSASAVARVGRRPQSPAPRGSVAAATAAAPSQRPMVPMLSGAYVGGSGAIPSPPPTPPPQTSGPQQRSVAVPPAPPAFLPFGSLAAECAFGCASHQHQQQTHPPHSRFVSEEASAAGVPTPPPSPAVVGSPSSAATVPTVVRPMPLLASPAAGEGFGSQSLSPTMSGFGGGSLPSDGSGGGSPSHRIYSPIKQTYRATTALAHANVAVSSSGIVAVGGGLVPPSPSSSSFLAQSPPQVPGRCPPSPPPFYGVAPAPSGGGLPFSEGGPGVHVIGNSSVNGGSPPSRLKKRSVLDSRMYD